ncbi:MAG TPA: transcription antitermination factor NusB [Desulfobacterales bacterium]|nr:transcription antitermination factor NusB [Desulfobacterales bacterium]
MGKRRRSRELALQVLFHLEFSSDEPERAFDLICLNFDTKDAINDFALDLVRGVAENREKLDRWISTASRNWRVERMSRVDRTILRMATYELLYLDDIPPKVSIDEAVELGKKYGNMDSGAFINGILDNIYKQIREQGGSGIQEEAQD